MPKTKLFALFVAFFAALFFASSVLLEAQRLTGTIRGTVKDEGGESLPGATVEIKSPALIGGAKTALTPASGVFLFAALPPGSYTVTFTMPGFQPIEREKIIVSVGKTTTIDVVLRPSTLQEEVTVISQAPVVDVTKSGISTTYDQQILDNVPKARFTYIDIMLWAPGVSAQETQTEEWHSSLGSNYWSDNYLVDGLDTSFDYNGTTWVWNNPDIYQEGEVLTIGAPAEYGDFQGAVVNVVTKSGGNKFQGGLNLYTIPSGFVGNNAEGAEYPFHIQNYYDTSLELAGPLKKDKFWYYANVQYRKYDYSQLDTDPEYPTKSIYNRAFLKSTIQLSKNHRLMASYQYEWYDLPDPITVAMPYDACGKEPGWYHVPNLMLTSVLSPNTIFEFKIGGWYAHDEWVPMDGNLDEPMHEELTNGYWTNGIDMWTKATAKKLQANAALSHFADDFIKGNHEFKVGVQFTRGSYAGITSYSGGVKYYDYDGEPSLAYFQNPYNYGASVDKIGVFIDDSWSITDRLTLNLGVRFDHQDGDVWEVDEIDANRNPTGKKIPGIPNVLSWNNVAPRLGFVYSLTSDKKTTLRASYGHYYEGMALETFFRLSPSSPPSYGYEWNPETSAYDKLLWTWVPQQGLQVGSDLKNSLCRQFSVGLSRELFPDFGLELTYVYKYTDNFWSWWDTASQFEPVDYTDEYSGKTITVYNMTTNPDDKVLTLLNPPDYKQRYQGLFITMQKRLSHNWQMSSSFVFSKAEGVSTGAEQLQQGDWEGLENPNYLINNIGWRGRLQSDRPFMFKLQGTYFLPSGFSISANYSWQSGKPIARTILVTGLTPDQFEVLAEPRGSKWRLDDWNMLDLRVEKSFAFAERYQLRVAADVFNLRNQATMTETLTTNGTGLGFMEPATIVPPLRVQISLRAIF